MASVRRIATGGGWSWRIEVKRTYRGGDQFRWSHNMPEDPAKTYRQNETDAKSIGVQAERDLDSGVHPEDRFVQKPIRPTTVGDWIATWRVDRGLAADSQKAENNHLDNYILPTWRDVPLDREHVTRLAVQQWVNRLPGAPRSVRLYYGTFAKMIKDAVDEVGIALDANPASRITLPKPEPTGRRALTDEEARAIVDACGVHKMLVKTLWGTGARIGELLSRDVQHFSPLAGIELPPATRRRGQKPLDEQVAPRRRKGGKTPSAIRVIGLCGSNRQELIDYIGDRKDGPLFVGRSGQRPSYAAVWRRIVAACEKVAADPSIDFDEPVSPHWFRHTHKTMLRAAHCDPVAINERIGHRTGGMDEIYVHVTPAMQAEILAVIEERWQSAFGPSGGAAATARRSTQAAEGRPTIRHPLANEGM